MHSNLIIGIAWLLVTTSAVGCAYLMLSTWAVRQLVARPRLQRDGQPATIL